MTRQSFGFLMLVLGGAFVAACASDYKVHAEKDPSPEGDLLEVDSADPEIEDEPEDTGEENTIEEPDPDKPVTVDAKFHKQLREDWSRQVSTPKSLKGNQPQSQMNGTNQNKLLKNGQTEK